MSDRRIEPRMMCADLVDVQWRDARGREQKSVANLEDISTLGLCIQVDAEIPLRTMVHISVGKADYSGLVRYCVYREFGYFVGVEFERGVKWNARNFRPMHLFDPRRLSELARPK